MEVYGFTDKDMVRGQISDAVIQAHIDDEAKARKEQLAFNAEMHDWKNTVATKEDIREVLEFMKRLDVGVGIFKFTWDNAAKIGSFLLLIGGLVMLFKGGIAGAVAWLFSLGNSNS